MPNTPQTYTYRDGVKVPLDKSEDQIVVQGTADELAAAGFESVEQISEDSARVAMPSATESAGALESAQLADTQPAYFEAETGQEFLLTDRIFVTFRNEPTDDEFNGFLASYALLELEQYSERDYLFEMTAESGGDPVALVVQLMEEEDLVEIADHDLNYRAETYAVAIPTDPRYAQQWHLHTRLVNSQFDSRSSALCEDAWQLLDRYGNSDVVIGVTDDGCLLDHPDFDSQDKFAGWGYFQGRTLFTRESIGADPDLMHQTGSNHGTSCAGVIAGEVDAVLTVGAAPGCRLLPIKWESDGPSLFIGDSRLLAAINYMADKVDVVSNSWGSTPTSNWSSVVKRRIRDLAITGGRRGNGIVFLWAAGNENCPILHNTTQDVPFTSGWQNRQWVGVRTSRRFFNGLVGIPGVMHVAALASTARRSHYSNYGTGIGLCAPTSNVHKYRRLRVNGLGITTATGAGGGVTSRFGGTSSATPLVAGVAGLVISANPNLSALEVISLLKRTASKELDFTDYPKTPPAPFNQDTSWDVSPIAPFNSGAFQNINSADGTWSPWFGHGRVDAPKAVAEAIRLRGDDDDDGGPTGEHQFESAPNQSIPDNDPVGIQDTIAVDEDGMLTDISVTVGIEHTWIGDLVVQLIAPDETRVILHNRTGSSTDNISATYALADVSALAALKGKTIRGDWILQVQDLAQRDIGTLRTWSIAFKTQADNVIVEESQAVAIPDNDTAGIVRTLSVSANGTMRDLALSVDITHTYIGDLRVALTSPTGNEILLHNRTGRSTDNLITTWHSVSHAGLQTLRGIQPSGDWQLSVADLAGRDVGKLNKWKIEITL